MVLRDKQILVTGGAGAIGSNLVRRLVSEGAFVVVVDDLSSGHHFNLPAKVEFFQKDISRGFGFLKDYTFDYVFHCAAFFANQNSVDHPLRDLEVNGTGTIQLLESVKGMAGLKKLVYLSSSCVYGPRTGMLQIDNPIDQLDTPYGITKYIGEKYCDFYRSHYGTPITSVRLFNSYGPGELPGMYRNVIPNFMGLALAGEALTITGTGDETRDFTFVEDTVDGILRAAFYKGPLTLFNLGTGSETRIADLAEAVNRITGNPAGISFVPRRDWDHIAVRKADISQSQKELGYNPTVTLEDGLTKTYEWLKSHIR